ncbi:MAG: NAD(P)H-binding protein [Xanthomonadales bacterium]|nr:NAD(P)H-binding protein [Xanthomonadales bacterium]
MAIQRVLVAGASGYIGRAVAQDLGSRGHGVLAGIRELPAGHRPDQAVIDSMLRDASRINLPLQDPDSLTGIFARHRPDAVVSCLASRSGVADDAWRIDYQANANLLSAARAAGVRRFVLLSAICVQKPRLAFQFAKLRIEQELTESGLEFAIVRPTAFYKSLAGQVSRVREGRPFLVFGDGELTACKPISSADLAAFIAQQVEAADAPNQILPIGGNEPAITPLQQGKLLFELAGRPARFRHVPVRIFSLALAGLNPLGMLSRRFRKKAELARIGRYYATESMLLWNDQDQRYQADQTPGFGSDTLREFYQSVINHGDEAHQLGQHKLF